jgi:GPH family glycoside/pentoside/hexuronide:cation symporter
LSDRVNTKWGRRRPFLLFGAVPFGLTFFLLFYVPPIESERLLTFYYAAAFLLFDTMYTVINVPYAALTPELTPDYDERSSLAGWRIATAILAALIAGATFRLLAEDVIASSLAETMGIERALQVGYTLTAALWSATLILSPLILFFNIEEPEPVARETEPIRPVKMFVEVFRNRPFRLAAAIYLLSFTAADIVVSVFVWFLVFYVGVANGFDSLVLGLVLGVAFITMPVTVKLMRKFGKRTAYMATMAIYSIVLIIMSQLPPGGQVQVLVAALFAGFGFGAANVIPWAMLADVVDVDELNTGRRREGLYSGYMVFLRKLATALAIFVVTRVLASVGFQESTTGGLMTIEQPERALVTLRLLVGVVPALLLVLSVVFAWRYPLSRTAHQQILARLAQKRNAISQSQVEI